MRQIFWARGRDPRPAPPRAPELLQIWRRLHDFSILGAEICHKVTAKLVDANSTPSS